MEQRGRPRDIDFGRINSLSHTHQGMIIRCANAFCKFGTQDYEELCHAGILGLYMAKASYRKGHGTKFSTWAFPVIRKEIQRCWHTIRHGIMGDLSWKRHGLSIVSINHPDGKEALDETDPSDTRAYSNLMDKDDAEETGRKCAKMLSILNCHLTVKERGMVLDYFVRGHSYGKIAKKRKFPTRVAFAAVLKAKKLILAGLMPPE